MMPAGSPGQPGRGHSASPLPSIAEIVFDIQGGGGHIPPPLSNPRGIRITIAAAQQSLPEPQICNKNLDILALVAGSTQKRTEGGGARRRDSRTPPRTQRRCRTTTKKVSCGH